MKRHFLIWIVLIGTQILVGCGGNVDPMSTISPPSASVSTNGSGIRPGSPKAAPISTERVTQRKPNLSGRILVTEYHHILAHSGPMYRSPDAFRKDLSRLYRLGFRPVTVSEYLANRMSIPHGATPVVFTFDDSNPTQLRFNNAGKLESSCAMGIWVEFAKTHPDFPPKATFYVLPGVMWQQPRWVTQKINWIRSNGGELANHTMTHPKLSHLSDVEVMAEIGEAEFRLKKLGEMLPSSLALPFGISPKNRSLLAGFTYKGQQIHPKAVFMAGAEPSRVVTDKKWSRLRIPRVQACLGEDGLDYWLEQIQRGRVQLYVAP